MLMIIRLTRKEGFKMKKSRFIKLGALFLALMMCICSLQLTAFAANSDPSPYEYRYTNWYARSVHKYKETGSSSNYLPATYLLEKDGEEFATYCIDLSTSAVKNTMYKRLNLEDVTYFKDSTAAGKVRTIVNNGFWPDNTNSTLEALKKATGKSTLNAAEALSGTQLAIWEYGNSGDVKISSHYSQSAKINTSAYGTYQMESGVGNDPNPHGDLKNGYSATTYENIMAVRQYLLDLSEKQAQNPSPDEIIINNDHFLSGYDIVSAKQSTAGGYEVTISFTLESTNTAGNLILTASQNGNELYNGNLNNISSTGNTYTLSLKTNDVQNDIKLSLSGTQDISNGVYFYQADSHTTSQSFVGRGSGSTYVNAEAMISLKDISAGVTLNVTGKNGEAVEGSIFELYDKETGESVGSYTTDENGKIEVDLLNPEHEYYFVETKTTDGYKSNNGSSNHYDVKSNGYVNVTNDYDVGGLTVSKTVAGNKTDEHFSFSITLDGTTASLANIDKIFGDEIVLNADWSNKDCTDGSGMSIHTETVTFIRDSGKSYTADISLAGGESVTLSGIPVGISYTVTETDSKGYDTVNNITGNINSGINSTADFTNKKYDTGSLTVDKTVIGIPTSEHFSFSITLDGETEGLVNIDKIFGDEIVSNANWSDDSNETLHPKTVTFTRNGDGKYVTQISLADRESVTLSEIPAGMSYTVTETDSMGYESSGDVAGRITSGVESTASFVNTLYSLNSLTVNKTVVGNQTDEHFSFSITLDSKAEDLINIDKIFSNEIALNADWNGANCTDGDGTSIHTETITFTQNDDGKYVAVITLAGGESVTISGIPVGMSYTVTETESKDYKSSGDVTDKISGDTENKADFVNTYIDKSTGNGDNSGSNNSGNSNANGNGGNGNSSANNNGSNADTNGNNNLGNGTNGNGAGNSGNSNTANSSSKTKSPSTGNNSSEILVLAIAVFSICGFAAYIAASKKKRFE